MILKRIGPFSCAKVSAVMHLIMGLLIGLIFSVIAMVSIAAGNSPEGALFGLGAVVILPIFYGGMGFLSGWVMAWLYNLVFTWIGGLEVEFEQDTLPPQDPSVTG